MKKSVPPGSTIGIVGGGQLGLLTALAGIAMGYEFVVLDPDPDCPCKQITQNLITAPYDDLQATKQLGEQSDLQICEFENAELESLSLLEEHYYFPQTAALFKLARNRVREKELAQSLDIPVVTYADIRSGDDLQKALSQGVNLPAILKAKELGYDGKRQSTIYHGYEAAEIYEKLAISECILEEKIELKREASIIVAKSASEVSCFPLIQNHHFNNILHHSIMPSDLIPVLIDQIRIYALLMAESLNFRGLLTLEFFLDAQGQVYFNEMAPRPHNSGHLTINACQTSQFEQFIRATCNLPLGETSIHTPCQMNNIIGQSISDLDLSRLSHEKLYWYGKKESPPGRKMGHWVKTLLTQWPSQISTDY